MGKSVEGKSRRFIWKKYPNICLGELSKHMRHLSTVSAMSREGSLQDKVTYFAAKEISTMWSWAMTGLQ